jgi:hypothetical protein
LTKNLDRNNQYNTRGGFYGSKPELLAVFRPQDQKNHILSTKAIKAKTGRGNGESSSVTYSYRSTINLIEQNTN